MTSIGNSVFERCSNLKGELVIPDTVTNIGTSIFWRTKLSEITLGKGITTVPGSMFYWGNSLTKVIFKNSEITNISGSSFYNCSNLTTLEGIDWKNVSSIGTKAFYGCERLEGTVTLNETCTFDEETTFFNCPLKVRRGNTND